MRSKKTCPRCSFRKIYIVRRGKRRCARCRYEWLPYRLPLYLSRSKWIDMLRWFLHGLSTKSISYETGINRQRIHRALNVVRTVMGRDIPDIFSETIKVDETHMGGQWKNKLKEQHGIQVKRGRGTLKTPMFGILCRGGRVWAEVVPYVEAKILTPLIDKQIMRDSIICSGTWKSYTGIASRGYVHRLVGHGNGEYTNSKGHHINGLEGFWGYLKRKLASKGGIRKERLSLYLAEYVWRFNHRNLTNEKQIDKLLNLLYLS